MSVSYVHHKPKKGEFLWSRSRWDENKQPNGVIISVKYDEIQVRFGDRGWDEFPLDEVECGERVTKAGKVWWILGGEPTPEEFAAKAREKSNATS